MNKLLFAAGLLCALCIFCGKAQAQTPMGMENATGDEVVLSLSEIIEMAREQSVAYQQASTSRENSYWSYRTFISDLRPNLVLQGTLPDYRNSINQVQQPDGSFSFVNVRQARSNAGLFLQQVLPWTGAELALGTSLQRFDNFLLDPSNPARVTYSVVPADISLRQPLFQFNPFKWSRQIEPLRFDQSQKQYVEDLEDISLAAIDRFFALLLAQINYDIAQKNLNNNDTIYKIGQGRYNLGKLPENDLLQMEVAVLTAQSDLSQAELDLETSSLNLKAYIGLQDNATLRLMVPDSLPPIVGINIEKAILMARKNRATAVGFEISKLEADRQVAQARAQAGFSADLNVNVGFNNQSQQFDDLYARSNNAQNISLGFTIPVVNWGRLKARVNRANAFKKLTDFTIQQDSVVFDQAIFTAVRRLDMLRSQLEITTTRDEISQKRYEIAQNRYLIGRISVTDLNIALQDKDQARRTYVASLQNFWRAWYTVRKLTLFDFVTNDDITLPAFVPE